MIAEFKTENAAADFMGFLNDRNNQGHKNVFFGWEAGNNVEYSFNEYVFHDDIFDQVREYLKENEGR